ncbi:VOC family protein [Algimonas porphyrae]|uniref:VOC family protein n=1 Tax=Algimonas porphyrae TaxID=1128113 RepID=A0ABQ5UZA4_9PROT|nr:VOC family protein [Algimonas porphyrae]GLQ19769.1 hypothetical protein GCM10007854_07240 [Algimonas porphyrae]
MEALDAKPGWTSDTFASFSTGAGQPTFAICTPFDDNPATVGNGTMIALLAGTKDKVDAMHAKALALGGTDEVAPGLRADVFYLAYFRDLDGNKIALYAPNS